MDDKSAPHSSRPGAGVRDRRRWVAGAAYGSSHRVADGGNMLGENQCDYAAPEPAAGHPRSQRTSPNGGVSDYIDVLGGDLEVIAHRRM